jgi:ribosome maturation factor RimP
VLEDIVKSELESLGYDLIRLRQGGARSRPILEVRIDRRDGQNVTVEDCARVSRALSARFDAGVPGAAVLAGRYELQVSSPGDARRAVTERTEGAADGRIS